MKFYIVILTLLLFTACGVMHAAPMPPIATAGAPPATRIVFTPIPTIANVPQSTAASLFQLNNNGKTVVFDFTARLCEAIWMNSARSGLPCPGDLNNPTEGIVGLLSGIDHGLDMDFPMIMVIPASGHRGGIFERYPKFQILPNDEFRTTLACRANSNCDGEITLAYYDANGKYQETFPVVHYRQADEGPINIVWPLSGQSGQTVDFVLVARAAYQSDPLAAWALWISPRILR